MLHGTFCIINKITGIALKLLQNQVFLLLHRSYSLKSFKKWQIDCFEIAASLFHPLELYTDQNLQKICVFKLRICIFIFML